MATSYLFRLNPDDRKNRKIVEKAAHRLHGELVPFQQILSSLLRREADKVILEGDLLPSSK